MQFGAVDTGFVHSFSFLNELAGNKKAAIKLLNTKSQMGIEPVIASRLADLTYPSNLLLLVLHGKLNSCVNTSINDTTLAANMHQ